MRRGIDSLLGPVGTAKWREWHKLLQEKIVGESASPPGVKNPCLIAQVLSKRTGIYNNLIEVWQSVFH
jgi:hypothetical protein